MTGAQQIASTGAAGFAVVVLGVMSCSTSLGHIDNNQY
jgi:hypothetical protein